MKPFIDKTENKCYFKEKRGIFMQAILWKIISAIMSVVFFFAGLIPGSNLNEPKPVEDIKVFDGVFISIIGKEKYHVFTTHPTKK